MMLLLQYHCVQNIAVSASGGGSGDGGCVEKLSEIFMVAGSGENKC